VAQWSLDLTAHTSLSPIRRGFAPSFVNYKKDALDSQPQESKLTSCLPRVGGSLRVLRLPEAIKTGRHDIAEILLKVTLRHQQINQSLPRCYLLQLNIYSVFHLKRLYRINYWIP
jgi:hypothetical protein